MQHFKQQTGPRRKATTLRRDQNNTVQRDRAELLFAFQPLDCKLDYGFTCVLHVRSCLNSSCFHELDWGARAFATRLCHLARRAASSSTSPRIATPVNDIVLITVFWHLAIVYEIEDRIHREPLGDWVANILNQIIALLSCTISACRVSADSFLNSFEDLIQYSG